ncbi:MAG: biotin--[acetyl-CoA-carboxylase] ligase [Planctomycetes bacterium]|nr:biotin--[acetyl-CoA-carboxylase] ligase [Planctomycetota bacterium]
MGRKILCLKSVGSTNDAAWSQAVEGAPHGTAIFAEEQRRGRGRMGREWFAPRGTSILCSVILRPEISVDRVPLVTAAAALAAADAVEEAGGIEAGIRFPNDVVSAGKKLAGVLVESRFISGRPDLFVAGIGVNVNVAASDFPKELRATATSLSIEKGEEVSRIHVARALMEAMERWADDPAHRIKEIRKAWRDRSEILNRRVRIRAEGKTYGGVVEEVDPIEGIEVRLDAGPVRVFRGEHIEKLDVAG